MHMWTGLIFVSWNWVFLGTKWKRMKRECECDLKKNVNDREKSKHEKTIGKEAYW